MVLMKLFFFSKGYIYYGFVGFLNLFIFNLSGVFLFFVVFLFGVFLISLIVENGIVRVLFSKFLRRKDFFLGMFLSDVVVVFFGMVFYVGVFIVYVVYFGGGRRVVEIGFVFGVFLFFLFFYYFVFGYLFLIFIGGRKVFLILILLVFLLDFVVLIVFMVVFGCFEEFVRKVFYFLVLEV